MCDREPAPEHAQRRSLRAEMTEGLRFVVTHPILRMITSCFGLGSRRCGQSMNG